MPIDKIDRVERPQPSGDRNPDPQQRKPQETKQGDSTFDKVLDRVTEEKRKEEEERNRNK
jgi:hypothetical protein